LRGYSMNLIKRKKLLLTTSSNGDVIIAEVGERHPEEKNSYFVSRDFVRINVEKGHFTDMTGKLDYEGKIYVMDL